MTRALFAFDTEDEDLGDFYKECKTDIESFFNDSNYPIDVISGKQLNDLTISLKLENITHFVFGAYSHGAEDSLVVSGVTPYISNDLNSNLFEGAFFYTFSCSSGKELGKKLIEEKCQCFIGYKKKVAIYLWRLTPFVITANYGFKLFFNKKSTDEIIYEMKEEYTNQIDKIYKKDFFVASILRDNKEALIMHGRNIRLEDLGN